MKSSPGEESAGYAFALSRLVARLCGRPAHYARWSRSESFGLGIFMFLLDGILLARLVFPVVRPIAFRVLVAIALPFAVWIAWLLLYYMVSLGIRLARMCGMPGTVTDHEFQHVVAIILQSAVAAFFLYSTALWLQSLGAFWLLLVLLDCMAAIIWRAIE